TLNPATAADLVDDTVSVTTTSTGPYVVGSHTINWSATDAKGNTATATSLMVITDTTAPALITPVNITAESISGQPIDIPLPTVIGTDLVDGQVTAIADNTGPFSPGQTQVNWTVTDTAGNSASVTQTITVTTPNEIPTIETLADITLEATGALTAVTLIVPLAMDKEDGILVAQADYQGLFAVGTTVVTWSVKDSVGQSAFSTQQIIITDTTAPTIAQMDDQQVEATANQTEVTLNQPTATDLVDGSVTATTTTEGPFAVGEHTIDWVAKDQLDNTANSSTRLIVSDTTAPVFEQTPEAITQLSVDGQPVSVELPVVSAQDLVDGQIIAQADNTGPFAPGEHFIVYKATDTAGNESSVNQIVTITLDDTAPLITAPSDITLEATGTLTAVALGAATVSDDFDQNVEVTVDITGPFAVAVHTITWTAKDASGNQSTATQLVTITDTTSPILPELSAATIDSQGFNTLVNVQKLGQVVADDIVDGTIEASLSELYMLESGRHQVIWTVSDQQGNASTTAQTVDIRPLVSLGQEKLAEPDSVVTIGVRLNGDSAVYPVVVELALAGNAVDDGFIPHTASVTITQGRTGVANIVVPQEITFVENDLIMITISQADNASIANNQQTSVRLVSNNQPPIVNLSGSQNSINGLTFARAEGIITVNAQVLDVNVNDSHSLVWTIEPAGIVDQALDNNPLSLELDPQSIIENQIKVTLTATEENANPLEASVTLSMTITDVVPILTAIDSDGDGVNDDDEGLNDSDGDGISDYLDNDSSSNRLPITADNDPMETLPGLSLKVGETSSASQGYSVAGAGLTPEQLGEFGDNGNPTEVVDVEYQAVSPIVDFVISGLTSPGMAVPIVLPLGQGVSLPKHAQYRKFVPQTGWITFVDTDGNTIASAPRNAEGICPSAGHESYLPGLNEGDHCIELTIVDGGIYDGDGLANGHISDPGVVSAENLIPIAIVDDAVAVYEAELVVLNGSGSYDPEGVEMTYQWLQTAGTVVELIDGASAQLSFVAPLVNASELLTFTLTVNDGIHDSAPYEANVMVNRNELPIAIATTGAAAVNAGDEVILNGTDSTDPENHALTYHWQQTAGPSVTLSDVTGATVTFIAPQFTKTETLSFELVVNDGLRDSEPVLVDVLVNKVELTPPPVKKSSGGSLSILCLFLMPLLFFRRKTKPLR
ncbi:MAG: HYR domain-containing protein, partial [Psychrosphaera sp.]|nr:HYR domain-containing protein [Psychrosphaera sp.]